MSKNIFSSPASNWTSGLGPCNNIVISSRIRLARNLDKMPMPQFQDEIAGRTVLDKVIKAAEVLRQSGRISLNLYRLSELPLLKKQILLEKHLISREHLEDKPNKALLVSNDESISIMINEEDHLRIQVLYPGLQLEKGWEQADNIDNLLESELEYAFHEVKGYLTCCPTNVGTGLRASVMIHLPALVNTKQASKIFSTLGQLGLAVRGLYGEGTEATGQIFQISNQITLGIKETEIIQNLATVTRQIIEKEEETRRILMKEMPLQIKDKVGRAYGILLNSALLDSQEAFNLLSDIRMGIDLGLLDVGLTTAKLNELMVASQPGFIENIEGKPLEPMERDAARSQLFKEELRKRG